MNTYTTKQAAQILGCHPSTITRWIANGTLHAYKLNPRTTRPNSPYRIPAQQIHALLRQRQTPPHPD